MRPDVAARQGRQAQSHRRRRRTAPTPLVAKVGVSVVGETSAVGGPLLWGGSGGAAWCDLTRRPDPPASGALDEKTSEEPLTGPQPLWQAGALRASWLVDTSLQSSTVTAWPSLCASVAPPWHLEVLTHICGDPVCT